MIRIRTATPLAVLAALCLLLIAASSASAAPPTISHVNVSHVSTESLTLEAEINPEEKAVEYHFEYGPSDCSAVPDPCIATPIPAGKIKKGGVPVPVSASLEGLTPATTYHVLVVAKSNDVGSETKSPDRTFATYAPPPTFASCPNDAFRAGELSPVDHPSAALPDCRAYEQASPTAKDGADARGRVAWAKASVNGDAVTFLSTSGIPGAVGSQEVPAYISSRGDGAWSTQGLLPPATIGQEARISGWTPDFSQVFDWTERFDHVGGATLLDRSSADGSLATIVPFDAGLQQIKPAFAGASPDGSQILFESQYQLSSVPTAIAGKPNLYLWDRDTDTISLVDLMNGGQAPSQGGFAGPYQWEGGTTPAALASGGAAAFMYTQDNHVFASDGSVYFTAAQTGQLYLRRNPTKAQSPLDEHGNCEEPALACTVHISASEKTDGMGPGGTDATGMRPAAFMAASTDGSTALFTSSEKLTDGATTGPEPPPAAIARAGIGGIGAAGKNLSFLPAHADGIAVFGEHIYWANPEANAIGRAKLNGASAATEVNEDFITGANNPQGVAVDAEYVYWTNAGDEKAGDGTIGRAELGGGNLKQDFIAGITNPRGVDVDADHIYWGDNETSVDTGTLGRANIDGTSVDQEFINTGGGDVAVNGSKIFVSRTNGTEGFIRGYNLDGSLAILNMASATHSEKAPALALDGSHLYWTNPTTGAIGRSSLSLESNGPHVYDLTAKEVEQEFIPAAGGPAGLALDGEHLYWSANQEVLPNPGNDLYRYDPVADEAGHHLTDLTSDLSDENGAEVQGVLGASGDASNVYFAANGDLDDARPTSTGDCGINKLGNAVGECNLYVSHEGAIDFIARLDANGGELNSDSLDWRPSDAGSVQKTARVSADGRTLLFRSQRQLTPYQNEGIPELYLYRFGDPGLICVSCNPTGAAPLHGGFKGPRFGSIGLSTTILEDPAAILSRNLSADGDRVFFESSDPLLADDTNGEEGCPEVGTTTYLFAACQDVYEWEANGAGTCHSESQNGGCLYLLSTGKSPEPSFFSDASASGNDAFLITRSPLVAQDGDQLYDVYDARVEGGLVSQNVVPVVPCEGEGCKAGASAPPSVESPGTASFSGPVNPKAADHHKRKHRKKRRHRHYRRHAKTTRKGSQ